jgi:hypothetical protein
VPDIGYLILTCLISYVIYLSWSINCAHLLKAKVPIVEVFHFIWVKSLVFPAVLSSSLVTKPNIIALISKGKSWCHSLLINDPTISRGKKAVLEEDDWLLGAYERSFHVVKELHCPHHWIVVDKLTRLFWLYSEGLENVPIFGGDVVSLM